MQIELTLQEPPYRTGTLTGLTYAAIQQMLGDIPPDIRPSADRKVTVSWRFLADGRTCGIWDYRRGYEARGELSTFGPDESFTELLGNAYTPL